MKKFKYEKPGLENLIGGKNMSFAAQCLSTGSGAAGSCSAPGNNPESACMANGTSAVGPCEPTGSDPGATACGSGIEPTDT